MRWLNGDGDGDGWNEGAVGTCFMVCGFRIQLFYRITKWQRPVLEQEMGHVLQQEMMNDRCREQLKEPLKVVPRHLEMEMEMENVGLEGHELVTVILRDEQEERRMKSWRMQE